MAVGTNIKGLDIVIANLNAEIAKIEGVTNKGLIMSAAYIRRDMEKTAPRTPVDLGNLRASWFVVSKTGKASVGSLKKFKGKKASIFAAKHTSNVASAKADLPRGKNKIGITMGYTANYAWYVHEMIGKNFKQKKQPGAGPKWFEASLARNKKKILLIIRDNVKKVT